MTPYERVERARLNMHLCFRTETAKRYLNARFTALALLVGAPGTHDWQRFADAFEKLFDLEPWAMSMTYVDEWRRYYARWYEQQEKDLAESNQVREV